MTGGDELSRRTMLASATALALAGTEACAQPTPAPTAQGGRTLVTYFTRSGNTKVIAGTIQRALGAELFEIRPARPYPEDYEETVAQATRERDSGFEPPLAGRVANIASHDEVYLGLPIWGETAPPVIRSFLKAHDLRGKTIRPFITHGGYGLGNSLAVLASHAPGAIIKPPFVMEADQERRTMTQVKGWLGQIQGQE
ncbi:flavodoxin [Novosphingobium rhizovicinum]|uniref:Flavodoxin n=1 Tax=Novosphingobium rhizovicinum TaxID=3228928 RepID=A0ABV3RC46_9SPHN